MTIAVGVLNLVLGVVHLWVVHALYRGTFKDWNGSPLRARSAPPPAAAEAVTAH